MPYRDSSVWVPTWGRIEIFTLSRRRWSISGLSWGSARCVLPTFNFLLGSLVGEDIKTGRVQLCSVSHRSQNRHHGRRWRVTHLAAVKSLNQSLLVDDTSASGVDENRAILHLGELSSAEAVSGVLVERHVERDGVGAGEEVIEVGDVLAREVGRGSDLATVVVQDLHAEREDPSGEGLADATHTDDTEGLALGVVGKREVLEPEAWAVSIGTAIEPRRMASRSPFLALISPCAYWRKAPRRRYRAVVAVPWSTALGVWETLTPAASLALQPPVKTAIRAAEDRRRLHSPCSVAASTSMES